MNGGEAQRAPSEGNWWVWACGAVRGSEERHLYGCMARVDRQAEAPAETYHPLPSGARLLVREGVLAAADAQRLRAPLGDGVVDLAAIGAASGPIAVRARRTALTTVLGHAGAEVEAHYTLPDTTALFGPELEDFTASLDLLERELNLPFARGFLHHIGNFDEIRLKPWLEREKPFDIAIERPAPGRGAALIVRRTEAFATERHIAHLVARAGGEAILDRLVFLEPGDARCTVEVTGSVGAFDVSLFDASGRELLHKETTTLVRRVSIHGHLVNERRSIEDAFTARMRSGGRRLGAEAAEVELRTGFPSSVEDPDEDGVHAYAEALRAALAERSAEQTADRWFARALHEEMGVIAHFNRLLDGARVKGAVLVDPFFSEDALTRLALRLRSVDVELTVVTSWGRTDPDTAAPVDAIRNVRRLEALLRRVGPLIGPRLQVLNLVRGGAEQAFHDRYLLLLPRDGPHEVYLLSNSVNAMAKQWPFCISQLTGKARLDAKAYVEGLQRKVDITADTRLTANFRWPRPADGPAA